MRLLTTLAMLTLTACGGGEPPPEDNRPEILKNLPDPLPCAKGEAKMGQTEKGLEQWCQVGDKMHGQYVVWHLTGKKKTEGTYFFNEPDKKWSWWFESGRQKSSMEYNKGKLVGEWTSFYENGQPSERGQYLAGMKTGTWTEYHPSGKKKVEGTYRNDQKDGEWQWWSEDGELDLFEKWDNGKQLL